MQLFLQTPLLVAVRRVQTPFKLEWGDAYLTLAALLQTS